MDTTRRRLLGSIQNFHGLTWAALGFAAVVCAQASAQYLSEAAYFSAFKSVSVDRGTLSWITDVRFSLSRDHVAGKESNEAELPIQILPVRTVEVAPKPVAKRPHKTAHFHRKIVKKTRDPEVLSKIRTAEEKDHARLQVLGQVLLKAETLAEAERLESARIVFQQLRGQFIEVARSDFNPIRVAAYHLKTMVKTTSIEPIRFQSISDVVTTHQAATKISSNDEYSSRGSAESEHETTPPLVQRKTQETGNPTRKAPPIVREYSAQSESPKNNETEAPPVVTAVSGGILSIQKQAPLSSTVITSSPGRVLAPPSALNTQIEAPKVAQNETRSITAESKSLNTTMPERESNTRRRFVEAFKEESEIAAVDIAQIERQPTNVQSGWIVTKAEGHVPTVAWMSSQNGYQMDIPLFSQITFDLLRKHPNLKVNIQSGTGIIFGKVSAGELIDANVRPDQIAYFSNDLRVLRSEELTTDRVFVVFNAIPGATLIRVQSLIGSRGAIPVLVQKGAATYVDLRAGYWTREILSGRVLDSSTSKPISNAEVAVIDQKKSLAVTDREGRYQLSSIDRLADMPYFLEVRVGTQYPHRYRQSKAESQERMLFVFNEMKIQDWISQLEGGVSADSGIVVGALKKPAAQFAQSEASVAIHSLEESSNLVPESYLLGRDGSLEPQATLSRSQFQLVGVQVPAGPAVVSVELQGDSTRAVWSEMSVVSPGVVSVVESY